jgi:hypothetical protein
LLAVKLLTTVSTVIARQENVMSKKTTIKKPGVEVSEKADRPIVSAMVEDAPMVEVPAEPVVTTGRPVAMFGSPREKLNGVTRPRPGKCGDVWEVCDELQRAGNAVTFEAIRAELPSNIADATIKTQRLRHRTFHSLGRKTS